MPVLRSCWMKEWSILICLKEEKDGKGLEHQERLWEVEGLSLQKRRLRGDLVTQFPVKRGLVRGNSCPKVLILVLGCWKPKLLTWRELEGVTGAHVLTFVIPYLSLLSASSDPSDTLFFWGLMENTLDKEAAPFISTLAGSKDMLRPPSTWSALTFVRVNWLESWWRNSEIIPCIMLNRITQTQHCKCSTHRKAGTWYSSAINDPNTWSMEFVTFRLLNLGFTYAFTIFSRQQHIIQCESCPLVVGSSAEYAFWFALFFQ